MAPTIMNGSAPAQTEHGLILESSPRKAVRVLTLNRPNARNAINRQLSKQLCDALRRAEADDAVRVVIISATAPVFCAGVDIYELQQLTPMSAYEQQWLTEWPRVMCEMKKPVVAAVDGAALGGGFELVLLADVVFASRRAQFGLPEILLGTIAGAGGTVRLVESVGKARALSMMWTGERMHVEEAFTRGIVAKICEDVDRESVAFAQIVASQSASCVRMTKEMVTEREREWHTRVSLEKMMYYLSFGSSQFQQGCDRFVRRRETSRE